MLNIFVLFAIYTIILVASLILADKFFGKQGLLTLQIAVIIISNFIVLKRFDIPGIPGRSLTMSVLVYPFIFVCSNFVVNKYGKELATKFANLTVLANLVFVVIMTLGTFTTAATGQDTNAVDIAFGIYDKASHTFSGGVIGMTMMGWVALYVALFISRIGFDLFHNKMKWGFLPSSVISAFLGDAADSIIFVTLGLCLVSGFLPWNSCVVEILFMVAAKTIVSTINTVLVSFKASKETQQLENN